MQIADVRLKINFMFISVRFLWWMQNGIQAFRSILPLRSAIGNHILVMQEL